MSMKNIHIRVTVGDVVEIDEDTDLFAGIYSTRDHIERVMMLRSDYLTLAEGCIEMSELCRSFMTALVDTLGTDAANKLLKFLRDSQEDTVL